MSIYELTLLTANVAIGQLRELILTARSSNPDMLNKAASLFVQGLRPEKDLAPLHSATHFNRVP